MVSPMEEKRDHLVVLQDTSEKSLAYAYIWGNEGDPDLYGEWDTRSDSEC